VLTVGRDIVPVIAPNPVGAATTHHDVPYDPLIREHDPADPRARPAGGHHHGHRRGSGQVLVAVRVPKLGPGWGYDYQKFHRTAQSWAIVGVAAAVKRENGSIAEARSR
jgi:hypothetical protein